MDGIYIAISAIWRTKLKYFKSVRVNICRIIKIHDHHPNCGHNTKLTKVNLRLMRCTISFRQFHPLTQRVKGTINSQDTKCHEEETSTKFLLTELNNIWSHTNDDQHEGKVEHDGQNNSGDHQHGRRQRRMKKNI